MQTEIVFETLCSEVLEALRNIGLGDHSIRNYYYEGMWPIIKAYRAEGKMLYDPVFINEFAENIQQEYLEGNVSPHIRMHVRKVASLFEEYIQTGDITWQRIKPAPLFSFRRTTKIFLMSLVHMNRGEMHTARNP